MEDCPSTSYGSLAINNSVKTAQELPILNFKHSRNVNFIIFLIILFVQQVSCQISDGRVQNSVVGDPYISCGADAIYAKWKTNKTFLGQINVRFAPNRFCFQTLITNNQIELLVPHLDCQVSRIRSLNPPGLILETSVLISFHNQFVTVNDRIYTLKCFHNRTAKKTHEETIVLPKGVPFEEKSGEIASSESPHGFQCRYLITDENGKEIDSAEVGQWVVHRWNCQNTTPGHCLLVTNCIVRTYDSQHEIVDLNGCSKDLAVMPQLEYQNSTAVEARVQVFGVAQRPTIHFQCQLSFVKSEESDFCYRPLCGGSQFKKRNVVNFLAEESTDTFDVISQELEIVQPGNNRRKVADCQSETKVEKMSTTSICIPRLFFVVITTSTIIVAICTLIVVLYFMWRRFRYMDVPSAES